MHVSRHPNDPSDPADLQQETLDVWNFCALVLPGAPKNVMILPENDSPIFALITNVKNRFVTINVYPQSSRFPGQTN